MQNFLMPLVSEFASRYPGCWQRVDKIRERRHSPAASWPDYCFLPFHRAEDVVVGDADLSFAETMQKMKDIVIMGTLAAWRVTQGIYRFDETLYEELWKTDVDDIPQEIFHRLPEWCVYIELRNTSYRGVFVHIEHNVFTRQEQLRFLFDKVGGGLNDFAFEAIELNKKTVKGGLEAIRAEVNAELQKAGYSGDIDSENEAFSIIKNVVSLVLYLCCIEADYVHRAPPESKHTKKGVRIFPPANPTVVEVGIVLGSSLKRGRQMFSEREGESGTSLRPHVRRAHYHHYWSGPRTDQELIAKWLPPIFVNIDKGELVTTIRPVKSAEAISSE